MNPERWRRIEKVYLRAADLSDAERLAYMERACAGDQELRELVERMLSTGTAAELPEPPPAERVLAALRGLALDLQGTQLGDFVLVEEIGRGGMGVVYRARQLELDRDVAIKVLPPPLCDDELAVERFRRESLAASRLHHPGIVPVFAAGRERGLFYYAMEFVDGWSLRRLLSERVSEAPDLRTPAAAAALICDVASALAHSHAAGVLHRDIKPQNILVERHGGASRLIDFGLAKVLDLESLSRTGDAAGTPLYMSPEQVHARAIDERTDVYSSGAVLYELLTGSPPFPGTTSHEVLLGITQGLLRPVRERALGVHRDLAAICEKALERDPNHRYRTANALALDLGRYLAGETVRARPRHLRRRAQHAITRRRVLQAAPLLALSAGGIGYLGAARRAGAEARARMPVLHGRLRGANGPVTAFHLAPADLFDTWLPESRLFRIADERFELRVPEGDGRVVFVDARGAFAEVRRQFAAEQTLEIDVRCALPEDVEDGMRRIGAGVARVQAVRFRDGGRPEAQHALTPYGGFLIDVRPVTRLDYRQYLENTHGFPHPSWDAKERARWMDPSRADWNDLPMTKLTPLEAMAYAEWAGKRLLTWTEWNAAVLVDGLAWLTDEQRDRATTPFNLGQGDPRASDAAYARHVVPVPPGSPLYGPHRLAQPLGNVHEMLESSLRTGERVMTSGAWHTPLEHTLGTNGTIPGRVSDNDAAADRGFRCAKSLLPFP